MPSVRAAMAPAAAAFYGDPTATPADGRRHRDQRQDHHRVPGPSAARGRRSPDRPARHGQERDRRRRARRGADDARGDRPPAHVPRDARRRRRGVRDGGLLARARAASRRRDPLRRRDLHQPDPGPPRLPRDDGGLLRGQAAAVRRRPGRRTRSSTSTTRTGRGWPRELRERSRSRCDREADLPSRATSRPTSRGSRFTVAGARRRARAELAAARPVQRLQRARRAGGRAGAGRSRGHVRRAAIADRRPGARAGFETGRRGPARSRCSSTTRTRPTRSRTCCAPRASSPTGASARRIRLRRRPRPRQAAADGRDRQPAGRPGDRDLRQPALRGPGGDHRRDPRRQPGPRSSTTSTAGARSPRRSPAARPGRRGRDRRQGPRAGPGVRGGPQDPVRRRDRRAGDPARRACAGARRERLGHPTRWPTRPAPRCSATRSSGPGPTG